MKNSLFNSGKYYDLFYKDKDYETELRATINFYDLPITLFTIEEVTSK